MKGPSIKTNTRKVIVMFTVFLSKYLSKALVYLQECKHKVKKSVRLMFSGTPCIYTNMEPELVMGIVFEKDRFRNRFNFWLGILLGVLDFKMATKQFF